MNLLTNDNDKLETELFNSKMSEWDKEDLLDFTPANSDWVYDLQLKYMDRIKGWRLIDSEEIEHFQVQHRKDGIPIRTLEGKW